jgi:hypothetical protein
MSGAAVFSIQERAKIRMHLGYPSVSPVQSIGLGFPAYSQPLWLVEKGMDLLLDEAVPLVRNRVQILDDIERQIDEARTRMRAERVGDITMRADETSALRSEYMHQARQLADILGAPINMNASRFAAGFGLAPVNSRVIHS